MKIRTLDSRLFPITSSTRERKSIEYGSKSNLEPIKVENLESYLTFLKELTEFQVSIYKTSESNEEDLYLKTLREEIEEFENWLQNLQEQNQSW